MERFSRRSFVIFLGIYTLIVGAVGVHAYTLDTMKTRYDFSVSTPIVAPQYIPENLLPTRIVIPSIDLDTNIIGVGVTPTGNLDVPPNYTEVGWYAYGPKPGEWGSAVLDGHVDNGSFIPGPFKRLREVRPGQEIVIEGADGRARSFTVIDSEVVDYTQFPGEKIFLDNSDTLIKIITCHGKFLPKENTYNQRLIVTARLTG